MIQMMLFFFFTVVLVARVRMGALAILGIPMGPGEHQRSRETASDGGKGDHSAPPSALVALPSAPSETARDSQTLGIYMEKDWALGRFSETREHFSPS